MALPAPATTSDPLAANAVTGPGIDGSGNGRGRPVARSSAASDETYMPPVLRNRPVKAMRAPSETSALAAALTAGCHVDNAPVVVSNAAKRERVAGPAPAKSPET